MNRRDVMNELVRKFWLPAILLAAVATLMPTAVDAQADESTSDTRRWAFDGELTAEASAIRYRLNLSGDRDIIAQLGQFHADVSLEIVDADGNVVRQGRPSGGGLLITTTLPTGQYFVAVRLNGDSETTFHLAVTSQARPTMGDETEQADEQASDDDVADRPAIIPGDFNFDGVVDQRDITPFVRALTNPEQFLAEHPWMTRGDLLRLGDLNGDGRFNFDDVEALDALLADQADDSDEAHDNADDDRHAEQQEMGTAEDLTAGSSQASQSTDAGTSESGGSTGTANWIPRDYSATNERSSGGVNTAPGDSGGGGGGSSGPSFGGTGGGGGGAGGTGGAGATAPQTDSPSTGSTTPGTPDVPATGDDETPVEPISGSDPAPVEDEQSEPEVPTTPAAPEEEPEAPSTPTAPEPEVPATPTAPDAQPEQPTEPAPEPEQPIEPAPTAPKLTPGEGWTGSTQTPPAIGNSDDLGYDAKAIARWDVIPNQTFDETFEIGVLAFHMADIDRVEFSVNNGQWVAVHEMSENPRTEVVEYWTTLEAADFPDGLVEVRAIAYPNTGEPRVLETLTLYANAGGSLPGHIVYASSNGDDSEGDGSRDNPYRTLVRAAHAIGAIHGDRMAGGGTVRLLPGNYVLGTYSHGRRVDTTDRWLTIESAPGVDRSEVVITGTDGGDGMRTHQLRLHNLTITGQMRSHAGTNGALWVDGCEMIGQNRSSPSSWQNGFPGGLWWTNTLVRDSRHGTVSGFSRNVTVKDIGENAWLSPDMIINSTVTGINRPDGTNWHMDLVHLRSDENVIIYGLHASDMNSQGIFTGRGQNLRNTAIAHCHIDNTGGGEQRVFQFMGPTEHMVVQDSTFIGAARWRVDEGFSAQNVMIRRSSFGSTAPFLPQPLDVEGVFYNPSPWLYD